jgi:hypothetical protein
MVGAVHMPPAFGAEPAPLPLKRARLYETGVGYFERTGPITGGGVGLPVPAGHLDDALKTLVVLSDDPGAHVGSIEFPSSLSPARARSLAGLPSPEERTPLGLLSLLAGLRGANVDVQTGDGRIVGRLVEVVPAAAGELEVCARDPGVETSSAAPCTPRKQASIVVLGTAGDIRRVPLEAVKSVRPTEPEFARSRRGARRAR